MIESLVLLVSGATLTAFACLCFLRPLRRSDPFSG